MNDSEWSTRDGVQSAEEFSLFWLGTTLLRHRMRILRWSLAFGVLAALTVIGRPRVYKAVASFIPQGADPSRSNLATLAGQFGVAIPTSGGSQSPEFYAALVKEPVLLRRIALDTFAVAEMGGRRVSFMELFKVEDEPPSARLEDAVRGLKDMITVSNQKQTGLIEITTTTKWPSVSLAIAKDLLDGVNEFNLHTRQSQANAERKFVETRLDVASNDLRDAEERLARFLVSNRQYISSPELSFQHGRLSREVEMKQSVYTSLRQAAEEARMREVRDTPVITVVEPPTVASRPEPRGRVVTTVLGLLFGAVLGAMLALLSAIVARRRQRGDAEVDEFIGTWTDLRSGALARVPFVGKRAPR
jgi:uncharacterized protein involved in exopolysaccharide biosynthesis